MAVSDGHFFYRRSSPAFRSGSSPALTHRLALGLEGQDLGIDVLELGVPVDMVAAAVGLALIADSDLIRPPIPI